jgi:o-succinylbenzoate---CoA ligase
MIFAERIRINNLVYSRENYHHLLNVIPQPWMEMVVGFLDQWFDDNDFIEVQTSGSTGIPKTIRLAKESMVHSAEMTCNFFHLTEDTTALLCLPADYIAGKMMVVRALVCGMNLLAVQPSANPFTDIKEPIDFTAITPYQFINSYQTLQELPIRKIIVGGSQVSLHLQKLMNELGAEIYETYGMTETCSHIALRRLNGKQASECFEILPGVEIWQDERDCLVIKAPVLTSTELVTNDVVELRDAAHFKWLGRFDNVVNTGGIKVFPEQVEKKLQAILDGRYFIASLPDLSLGEKVILVVEGELLSTSQVEELKNQFESTLKKYEIPKSIYIVNSFALSSSGKILKKKIVESLGSV